MFFIANERTEKWFPEMKIKRQTSKPFVLSSNGLTGAGSKFLLKSDNQSIRQKNSTFGFFNLFLLQC